MRRALAALLLASCASPRPGPRGDSSPLPTPAAASAAPAESAAEIAPAESPPPPPPSASAPPAPSRPSFSFDEVAELLLLSADDRRGCQKDGPRCLIAQAHQAELRDAALSLFDEQGTVLGLERAGQIDGGYRGMIDIVPERPAGRFRQHLGWVTGGLRDIDGFFGWLGERSGYRASPLGVRFYRSVGKRTPAAYAHGWEVAYNVNGGINTSADVVRETLFHEIFHLNDAARGFSTRALSPVYDRIVARCGTRTACLAPFAPHSTMVRGGTYYAFTPGNGVVEYAAELAVRYFDEHRALMKGGKVKAPFKCGPEENALAWGKLVAEMFGGVDRVPACSR